MLVISASRSRSVVSTGGCIGFRNVSNSLGSTNAIFLTFVIQANSWRSKGNNTLDAKGASNAGRKPPFCCRIRRFRATDVFLFTMLCRSVLYLRRRTFSCGVSRTVPLRMLCAHSQRALISSASAYSSIAFLSFALCVLFNICRQSTCLFTSLDMSVRSTQSPLAEWRAWRVPVLVIVSERKRTERRRRVGW